MQSRGALERGPCELFVSSSVGCGAESVRQHPVACRCDSILEICFVRANGTSQGLNAHASALQGYVSPVAVINAELCYLK